MLEVYEVKLSAQTLRVIGAALQELPYKVANPVLLDLQTQITKAEVAAKEEKLEKAESDKVVELHPEPPSA